MPQRITRLERWRQQISATTKFNFELVRFVESLTLLTKRLTLLTFAFIGLVFWVGVLVSTL